MRRDMAGFINELRNHQTYSEDLESAVSKRRDDVIAFEKVRPRF